ncbi:Anamorsin [Physocladia obscura]|uniref:Anamorsin n=1 Tax=Physocladia obscura TaxID=109957 RepID=A0AAD5XFK1_9FUNG|nr:Anamorsin [Physocladia obscura]
MEGLIQAGTRVLLVGNAAATADELGQAHALATRLSGGRVRFEQLDRLGSGAVTLAGDADVALSGVGVGGVRFAHSDAELAALAAAVAGGGVVALSEPVLSDAKTAADLAALLRDDDGGGRLGVGSLSARRPHRTLAQLVSAVKLAGLVDVAVASSSADSLHNDVLSRWCRADAWAVPDDKADAVVALLQGRVSLPTLVAKKPSYKVGSVAKLSFASKKRPAPIPSPVPVAAPPTTTAARTNTATVTAKKPSVWLISNDDNQDANDDDDDQELEDEDLLLDEFDKKAPVVPTACSDAATDAATKKKKACKNCTCGLADEIDSQEDAAASKILDQIVLVKPPKKAPTSSCGNCYLGDAFRCGSCPYLGMPAFKPGETVTLGGNLLNDDI